MNLKRLRCNQIQLIEYMEKGGYSKKYIAKIKSDIKKILVYGEKYKNYMDYYQNFIEPSCNTDRTKKDKLGILTLIMNFDLYNIFPNRNNCKYRIIDNSKTPNLNDYYKNIIDVYQTNSQKKNKKKSTIDADLTCCTHLFIHLQNKGYQEIKNIKENDILDFFLNEKNNPKYSYSFVKKIRLVLKETNPYIKEISEIIKFIPKIHNTRKNIEYLNDEEVKKIKDILNNENSNISLRDKAIVTLLLYTGIRKCDIVNLKLADIDWINEKINIIQLKTDNSLELPLTTSVGNALFKYITKERPKVNIDNLFIRMDANYPITKSSVETAVVKTFKAINIRQNDGKRKGTHIFRYNLATSLLKKEIPQPIISQVLGHTSSNALDFYLRADFEHLKQCSLSLEQFKNIKGVM